MPRASGKTTLLIKESAKTGRPIIEPNTASARYVEEQARNMGLKIPEPISATSWNSGYYRGSNFNRIDGFLIDELDSVLANIFGRPIDKATYTPEKIRYNIEYNGGFDMSNDTMTTMDGITSRVDLWNNNFIQVETGDKRGAFKVGDIVKVINVENIPGSMILTPPLFKYAGTVHQIIKATHDSVTHENQYCLDDCESWIFTDDLLEHVDASSEVIYKINIIVPEKVVEIIFMDGCKEKMICHEDDKFDLRKCCFIAIAKHLYKKEYTQEGIEHMATQLTYQKKYVKIVDKALKDYKKKEEEKSKKIRKEEEEKIVRARQSLKRRKQKERRAQKHKEVLVDLIADSINEAKKRRKANK